MSLFGVATMAMIKTAPATIDNTIPNAPSSDTSGLMPPRMLPTISNNNKNSGTSTKAFHQRA